MSEHPTFTIADYTAALATIDYLREQVQQYQDQLKKRDSYYSVKVTGNFWVYGSRGACDALQAILIEHQTKEDVQRKP